MYGVMHPFSKAVYEVDESGAVLITHEGRPGRPLPARRLVDRRRGLRRRSATVQLGRRSPRPAPPAERTESELTMADHRPFRFGAKAVKAGSAKEWIDIVRQAEDLGYASFQMDDHFGNQLGVVPALMAAADATTSHPGRPPRRRRRLPQPGACSPRSAPRSTCSAKARFTLGMGAGWSEKDYAIAGIQQDAALTRIERLGEAVRIMKGLWGEGPFSFDGEHYQVAEVDAVPKPYSAIPIMIGGGGPKILTLAAEAGRHRRHQPEDRRAQDQPRVDGHRRPPTRWTRRSTSCAPLPARSSTSSSCRCRSSRPW